MRWHGHILSILNLLLLFRFKIGDQIRYGNRLTLLGRFKHVLICVVRNPGNLMDVDCLLPFRF